jgi:Ca-activated chloride channel family protein
MTMGSGAAQLSTAEGRAIVLRGVEVIAEVVGGFAHARVRQTYQNDEAKAVEAIYTFPLPSDATLTGFTMTCDGRTIEGTVKEREEAFASYDGAISAGHGAALLDQERPNVFTASVGNLLPGEKTVIEVSYVQRVQADEGMIRWMVPTLVAPRYVPGTPAGDRTAHGTANPTARVPDADRISPPAGQVDYGVTLDLAFDLGAELAVESPSHRIVVTREGLVSRVRFADRQVALDRDVVVTARGVAAGPLATATAHAESEQSGVLALTVVPDLMGIGHTPEAQTVVFVVDVSGSMEGASIEQARAALRLCLRHLREGDRFNAIAFANDVDAFRPEPVVFTQRTLVEADAWVQGLVANGGTEMREPLLMAAKQAEDGVVVLLTDGQVGNEDEILAAVLDARDHARFYAFGIGTNVSDVLLRGLARRTGGAVEQIHPGERIDEKVIAQFSRATAARVSDVSVSFEGVDVGEIAPSDLPALVDGEPWTIFGRFERCGVGRATIRGKLRGEAFALQCSVDLAQPAKRPALAKLWAAERIKDLEGADLVGRRAAANKDRIVRLATSHQVASRYTSFVAVEKRTGDRRATGQPEARVVAVNLPAGWTMFDPVPGADFAASRKLGVVARPSYDAARRLPAAKLPARPAPVMAAPAPTASRARLDEGASTRGSPPPSPRALAHRAPMEVDGELGKGSQPEPVVAILERQLASGMWDDATAPGAGDEREVRATAKALIALLEEGVTTAHTVHGAQIKKAVDALLDRVPRVSPRTAELALAVSWLVASGPRTRKLIEQIVATEAAFASLRGRLHDGTLRGDLDRLATA